MRLNHHKGKGQPATATGVALRWHAVSPYGRFPQISKVYRLLSPKDRFFFVYNLYHAKSFLYGLDWAFPRLLSLAPLSLDGRQSMPQGSTPLFDVSSVQLVLNRLKMKNNFNYLL